MKKSHLLPVLAGMALFTACNNKPRETSNTDTTQVTQTDSAMVTPTSNPSAEPGAATLTAAEQAEGWKLLFDGSSTNGWHTYLKDSAQGWQAENGVLSTEGKHGDLVSEGQYSNFELIADFQIGEAKNSGIFYWVQEDPKYKTTYETGPEFQIIDDNGYKDKLQDAQKTGSNYDMQAPSKAAAKPIGEWNTVRIVVNKGHVEHWLNGEKVVEFDYDSPAWKAQLAKSKFTKWDYAKVRKGHIALQDHGDPVAFRNIRIREL